MDTQAQRSITAIDVERVGRCLWGSDGVVRPEAFAAVATIASTVRANTQEVIDIGCSNDEMLDASRWINAQIAIDADCPIVHLFVNADARPLVLDLSRLDAFSHSVVRVGAVRYRGLAGNPHAVRWRHLRGVQIIAPDSCRLSARCAITRRAAVFALFVGIPATHAILADSQRCVKAVLDDVRATLFDDRVVTLSTRAADIVRDDPLLHAPRDAYLRQNRPHASVLVVLRSRHAAAVRVDAERVSRARRALEMNQAVPLPQSTIRQLYNADTIARNLGAPITAASVQQLLDKAKRNRRVRCRLSLSSLGVECDVSNAMATLSVYDDADAWSMLQLLHDELGVKPLAATVGESRDRYVNAATRVREILLELLSRPVPHDVRDKAMNELYAAAVHYRSQVTVLHTHVQRCACYRLFIRALRFVGSRHAAVTMQHSPARTTCPAANMWRVVYVETDVFTSAHTSAHSEFALVDGRIRCTHEHCRDPHAIERHADNTPCGTCGRTSWSLKSVDKIGCTVCGTLLAVPAVKKTTCGNCGRDENEWHVHAASGHVTCPCGLVVRSSLIDDADYGVLEEDGTDHRHYECSDSLVTHFQSSAPGASKLRVVQSAIEAACLRRDGRHGAETHCRTLRSILTDLLHANVISKVAMDEAEARFSKLRETCVVRAALLMHGISVLAYAATVRHRDVLERATGVACPDCHQPMFAPIALHACKMRLLSGPVRGETRKRPRPTPMLEL